MTIYDLWGGCSWLLPELRSMRDLEKELRRRRSCEEKALLVVHMDSEAVHRIFGREMDAEVFQQLLEALEKVGPRPFVWIK